jgi:hypothetical protein
MAQVGAYGGTEGEVMMQWLAEVTPTGQAKGYRSADASELSDGRALCELINVLHDACLPRRSHIKISKMKMGAPMMNLPAFVEAARNLGVEDRDCFAPPDLTDDAWWALWSRQLLC